MSEKKDEHEEHLLINAAIPNQTIGNLSHTTPHQEGAERRRNTATPGQRKSTVYLPIAENPGFYDESP